MRVLGKFICTFVALFTSPTSSDICFGVAYLIQTMDILCAGYTPHSIKAAYYSKLLITHVKPALHSKRRSIPARSVILLQDNARPHTVRLKLDTTELRCEVLEYSPPTIRVYHPATIRCWIIERSPRKSKIQHRRRGGEEVRAQIFLSEKTVT